MSTRRQLMYRHGGLRVASELALSWTEDPEGAATCDVSIRLGSVPSVLHRDGSPVAMSFDDGDFRLSVAGVGRYLAHAGHDVLVDPEAGARPEDVHLYLAGAVFGAVWQQRGVLALHANAVLRDGACLLFAGRSGAGKSTLAAHLVRAGFPLVTDDVCVLTEQGPDAGVQVWPSASLLKLASDSLHALGEDPAALQSAGGTRGKRLLAVHGADLSDRGPIPVHRLYLLDWHDAPPEVDVLRGLDAVDAVAGHTYCADFVGPFGFRSRWLALSARVASLIPVRRLRRPRGLNHQDAVIAAMLDDAQDHHNSGTAR